MLGRLNHVAIAVKDAVQAAKIYAQRVRGRDLRRGAAAGARRDHRIRDALPNTKIEFIQPLGGMSPIAKFLERNADGKSIMSVMKCRISSPCGICHR